MDFFNFLRKLYVNKKKESHRERRGDLRMKGINFTLTCKIL